MMTIEQQARRPNLTRATKPGRCANGYQRDAGSCVHLVPNPSGVEHPYYLGQALCGTAPRLGWSDHAPTDMRICPRCEKKVVEGGAA